MLLRKTEHCNFGWSKAVALKENRGKANSLPSNSRKEFLLVLLHWVGTEEKANFSLLVLLNSNVLHVFI